MSIDVRVTDTVHRPREDVAAFVSDPANDTTWIGGIRKVEWVTEPPLRIGSRVRRVAGFMGRTFDYVLEVIDYEPGSKVAMKSVKAPFPMVVTYTFEDADGGTLAGIRVEGGAGLIFRVASPLMAAQVRRNLRGDLRRLKRSLES